MCISADILSSPYSLQRLWPGKNLLIRLRRPAVVGCSSKHCWCLRIMNHCASCWACLLSATVVAPLKPEHCNSLQQFASAVWYKQESGGKPTHSWLSMSVQSRMIEMNVLAYFTSTNCLQNPVRFQTPSQTPVSKYDLRNLYEGPNRMQLEASVKSAPLPGSAWIQHKYTLRLSHTTLLAIVDPKSGFLNPEGGSKNPKSLQ